MIFNDYKIKEVSPEGEFLFNLKQKTFGKGTHVGFLMGGFYGILVQLGLDGDKVKSDDEIDIKRLKEECESLYSMFDEWFDDYHKIEKSIFDEWERVGKPVALEYQKGIKKRCDEQDAAKAEYY